MWIGVLLLTMATGIAEQPLTEQQALEVLSEIHHGIKRSGDGAVIELHIGGVFPPHVSDKFVNTAHAFPQLKELSLGPTEDEGVSPDVFRDLQKLRHLESLVFSEFFVGPAEFEAICSLQKLTRLTFYDPQLTDKEFQSIVKLRNLKLLNTGFSFRLTSQSLETIAKLSQLETLYFECDPDQIEQSDIQYLRSLSNLVSLELRVFAPSDEDLQTLADLSKLQVIRFDAKNITGRGLTALQTAKGLREMKICNAKISGQEFKHFPKLESIDVGGSTVDDSSIETLGNLKHLKFLRIRDTRITSTGRARLKSLLPDCEIRQY